MKRCDAAIVTLIVTEYNEEGLPVNEQASQQLKIFRAGVPDIWAHADKLLETATAKDTKA